MKFNRTNSFDSKKLFHWYRISKRDLPWRRDPTPYKVWVSEIMLQQTQVKTVVPYFELFVQRFPTLKSLAQTPESDLLSNWSGLGYYSRARNLHRTAKIVQGKYAGQFPQNKEEILKLPGIGPYTAGAILSIAFHKAVPLLDGNVKRILSRFFLENSEDILWKFAEESVLDAASNRIDSSDHNQALMELGALVCLPVVPKCSECPLENDCLARKKNLQDQFPLKRKKNETIHQTYALFILKKGEKYLLHRRSERERWLKGLWEFPMVPLKRENSFKVLDKIVKKKLGYSIQLGRELGSFTHTITHHRLKIRVFVGRAVGKRKEASGTSTHSDHFEWFNHEALSTLSSSSILKKALTFLPSVLGR